MTVLYNLDEGTGNNSRPVRRVVAVGNALNDTTPWLTLGKSTPVIEARLCSVSGTRQETLSDGQVRTVAKYLKDQDATTMTSVVTLEFKQSNEDDDQAGAITTFTGAAQIQNMNRSEIGDYVRMRITTLGAGETVFMQIAARDE